MEHNATLSDLNSVPKGSRERGVSARKEFRWEVFARPNGQCVLCSIRDSKADAQPRNEVRSVASAVPPCQRRRRAFLFCRVCWSISETVLTPRRQSEVRGLRRDGCMGALGRTARSLPPWCQTKFVFRVRSASFASAACGAPRKLAVLTTNAVSCPCGASRANALSSATGEASRRNADVLAGRSLAAF